MHCIMMQSKSNNICVLFVYQSTKHVMILVNNIPLPVQVCCNVHTMKTHQTEDDVCLFHYLPIIKQ